MVCTVPVILVRLITQPSMLIVSVPGLKSSTHSFCPSAGSATSSLISTVSGSGIGVAVGVYVGTGVGVGVGNAVGVAVGNAVGVAVGNAVGVAVGVGARLALPGEG